MRYKNALYLSALQLCICAIILPTCIFVQDIDLVGSITLLISVIVLSIVSFINLFLILKIVIDLGGFENPKVSGLHFHIITHKKYFD